MKIGLPKGLMYYKYDSLINTFLEELGAEIITSDDTNKEILNLGVKYCVDEACIPIKVFHGHVASIKDQCDLMIIPRIISLRDNEYICPKFCGLPEMVIHNIPNMPKVTMKPAYFTSEKKLYKWTYNIGRMLTKDKSKINKAYKKALEHYNNNEPGVNDDQYKIKVMLAGHPYNIYDSYINMNLINKLNKLGIGVITEEHVSERAKEEKVNSLYKKPFWTFARNSYGACTHLATTKRINGIIYISSFGCGTDSVIIELIKSELKEFPFLVLKLDEQTGEAGFDTRLEAFTDLLERRLSIEDNISPLRERIYS